MCCGETEWLIDKWALRDGNKGRLVERSLLLLKYFISIYNTIHLGNFVLPAQKI